MQKQLYLPRNLGPHNIDLIPSMGREHPQGCVVKDGRDWSRSQVCHQDTFSLFALELFSARSDVIGYTRLGAYIKINFWLSGKHLTVLDGYGQHAHDRPEVFITAGPQEMIKVDVVARESQTAIVALCLLPEFFPKHLGIAMEDLPEPFSSMAYPDARSHEFCQFALTSELSMAARGILAAPFAVRSNPFYAQAKAVELMCLLLDTISGENNASEGSDPSRQKTRLYEAREILTRRYAEKITLEMLSREIGMNRMSLTSGFRQLFGLSVHDCLQQVRMERAYDLLQDKSYSIARISEAVGFGYSCNFSTAFLDYYGCKPQKARAELLAAKTKSGS